MALEQAAVDCHLHPHNLINAPAPATAHNTNYRRASPNAGASQRLLTVDSGTSALGLTVSNPHTISSTHLMQQQHTRSACQVKAYNEYINTISTKLLMLDVCMHIISMRQVEKSTPQHAHAHSGLAVHAAKVAKPHCPHASSHEWMRGREGRYQIQLLGCAFPAMSALLSHTHTCIPICQRGQV